MGSPKPKSIDFTALRDTGRRGVYQRIQIPAVLMGIAREHLTGRLTMTEGEKVRFIGFSEGRPTFAMSNTGEEHLRERLVGRLISKHDVTALERLMQRKKLRFGEAMMELGLIERAALDQELDLQRLWLLERCLAAERLQVSFRQSDFATEPARMALLQCVENAIDNYSEEETDDLTERLDAYEFSIDSQQVAFGYSMGCSSAVGAILEATGDQPVSLAELVGSSGADSVGPALTVILTAMARATPRPRSETSAPAPLPVPAPALPDLDPPQATAERSEPAAPAPPAADTTPTAGASSVDEWKTVGVDAALDEDLPAPVSTPAAAPDPTPAAVPDAAAPVAIAVATDSKSEDPTGSDTATAPEEVAAGQGSDEPADATPAGDRRRWPVPAIAAACVLLLGVAIAVLATDEEVPAAHDEPAPSAEAPSAEAPRAPDPEPLPLSLSTPPVDPGDELAAVDEPPLPADMDKELYRVIAQHTARGDSFLEKRPLMAIAEYRKVLVLLEMVNESAEMQRISNLVEGLEYRVAVRKSRKSARNRSRLRHAAPLADEATVAAEAQPEPAAPAPPPLPPSTTASMSTPERHYREAQALLKSRKALLAIQSINQCLNADENYAPAYRLLGKAALMVGRDKKAIEAFQKFVELAPNDPSAEALRKLIASYNNQ